MDTRSINTPQSFKCSLLNNNNVEDSGYHTPFTPSFTESFDPIKSCFKAFTDTPKKKNVSFNLESPVKRVNISSKKENTPQKEKRARKRSRREIDEEEIFTPTNIEHDFRKLNVRDEIETPTNATDSSLSTSDYSSFSLNISNQDYPTTPTKHNRNKIRKLNCIDDHLNGRAVLSPLKTYENISKKPFRSIKKLNFTENPSTNFSKCVESKRVIDNGQCKKLSKDGPPKMGPNDLITSLYTMSFLVEEQILTRLTDEELHNFSCSSKSYNSICKGNQHLRSRLKTYMEFIRRTKENHMNRIDVRNVSSSVEDLEALSKKSLKDIHNFINIIPSSPERYSPPTTPRTRRFSQFIRCGSQDLTMLLRKCTKCDKPAKVRTDESGEKWAECTSVLCRHTFCSNCSLPRHTGRKCIAYDLETASPAKRLREGDKIGDKKSKRRLRRL